MRAAAALAPVAVAEVEVPEVKEDRTFYVVTSIAGAVMVLLAAISIAMLIYFPYVSGR